MVKNQKTALTIFLTIGVMLLTSCREEKHVDFVRSDNSAIRISESAGARGTEYRFSNVSADQRNLEAGVALIGVILIGVVKLLGSMKD